MLPILNNDLVWASEACVWSKIPDLKARPGGLERHQRPWKNRSRTWPAPFLLKAKGLQTRCTALRYWGEFPGGPGLQGPLPCECQQRSLREASGESWEAYLKRRKRRTHLRCQRPAGLSAQPTAACGAGFGAFALLDGPGLTQFRALGKLTVTGAGVERKAVPSQVTSWSKGAAPLGTTGYVAAGTDPDPVFMSSVPYSMRSPSR